MLHSCALSVVCLSCSGCARPGAPGGSAGMGAAGAAADRVRGDADTGGISDGVSLKDTLLPSLGVLTDGAGDMVPPNLLSWKVLV
jgi:hypothetical protein